MDDIQKVLDAVSILQDSILATMDDKEAMVRLKAREDLPESMVKWIADKETPPAIVPPVIPGVPAIVAPIANTDSSKPKVEDFENEVDYAKALVRWDVATKAKDDPAAAYRKPIRENYLTDEEFNKAFASYTSFVKGIRDELEPALGEAIKKTLVPAPPAPIDQDFDIDELWESAGDTDSLSQFLYKEGIKL